MLMDFAIAVVIVFWYLLFFFFKQKTAYEVRISDWSSDLCSSDLADDDHDDVEIPPAIAVGHRAERQPDDRDRDHQPVRPAEKGNESRNGQKQGDENDQDRGDI